MPCVPYTILTKSLSYSSGFQTINSKKPGQQSLTDKPIIKGFNGEILIADRKLLFVSRKNCKSQGWLRFTYSESEPFSANLIPETGWNQFQIFEAARHDLWRNSVVTGKRTQIASRDTLFCLTNIMKAPFHSACRHKKSNGKILSEMLTFRLAEIIALLNKDLWLMPVGEKMSILMSQRYTTTFFPV